MDSRDGSKTAEDKAGQAAEQSASDKHGLVSAADHPDRQTFVRLNAVYFFKWLLLGSLVGAAGGLIGGGFANLIEFFTAYYRAHSYMMGILPFSGLLIVFLYEKFHEFNNSGTNMVITAIHNNERIHRRNGFLIFGATILSHMGGASVGKEGAALQIGGCLGTFFGEIFHLDRYDKNIMIMCGMAGVFSAVFGTPIGAAIFPIEMISVGVMYYTALYPCLLASIAGTYFAKLLGAPADIFQIRVTISDIAPVYILMAAVFGALCALLCIFFTKALGMSGKLYQKYIPNPYVRVVFGAGLYTLLILIFGKTYSNSGMNLIHSAIYDTVPLEAFLLKMLFTCVALGAGYKGGEIVPTLTIGCCFGYLLNTVIGLDPHFGAALGMIGLFAGMTNCPISSVFLGIEMFGADGAVYFAIVVFLAYALSGYMGLYKAQTFMYAKTKAKYINRKA